MRVTVSPHTKNALASGSPFVCCGRGKRPAAYSVGRGLKAGEPGPIHALEDPFSRGQIDNQAGFPFGTVSCGGASKREAPSRTMLPHLAIPLFSPSPAW